MSHWNFWEWLAYGCIWIAALCSAADMGVKMAPNLRERMARVISSPWWGFTPLVAISLGTIILLLREFFVLPNIPVWFALFLPLVVALGAVVLLLARMPRRKRRTFEKISERLESLLDDGRKLRATDLNEQQNWASSVDRYLKEVGEIDEAVMFRTLASHQERIGKLRLILGRIANRAKNAR
jgi:hypothetical protein